MVESFLWHMLI